MLRLGVDTSKDVPKLEQTVTPNHSAYEYTIRLQEMLDLRQRSDDIAYPMQSPG